MVTFTDIKLMRSALQSWLRFIRAESYVLKDRPSLLFQQAANRQDNIAVGIAAKRFRQRAYGRIWLEWLNKPRGTDPCLVTLTGHQDSVICCRFSPDGRRIASISLDDTLRTWDAETGQQVAISPGHSLRNCTYLPDGRRLIFSSRDGSLSLVDAETLDDIATLRRESDTGEKAVVSDRSKSKTADDDVEDDDDGFASPFALSPDGMQLAAGGVTGKVTLWNMDTLEVVYEIDAHPKSLSACAFSPDGRRMVTGADDGLSEVELLDVLSLWDVESGYRIATVAEGVKPTACCFSPDGQRLASVGAYRNDLTIWNVGIGRELLTLTAGDEKVSACAYSPDGQSFLTSAGSNSKVWDTRTGKERLVLSSHNGPVHACVYSPDGTRVVSASEDMTLKLWDAQTGREVRAFAGHSRAVTTCTLSPDGKRILSGSLDHTLRLWKVEPAKEVRPKPESFTDRFRRAWDGFQNRPAPLAHVTCCSYSPNGEWIAYGLSDGRMKIARVTSAKDGVWKIADLEDATTIHAHEQRVTACSFSPAGEHIVSASEDGRIAVWDSVTGENIRMLPGHSAPVNDCTYSPEGRLMVSASDDKTLIVWNAITGGECLRLVGHDRAVTACAFSLDAKQVLSGDEDGTIKVWCIDFSEAQSLRLSGHKRDVNTCVYSPDGRWLVSGADDKAIKIWNSVTGQHVLTLLGHVSDVFSCDFSSDGQRIVSASRDGTLKIWNTEAISLPAAPAPESQTSKMVLSSKHEESVNGCSYSPEGNRFVTVSVDGAVKVWDADSGSELFTFEETQRLAFGSLGRLPCSYSPDAKRLALASPSGLTIWDTRTWKQLSHLHPEVKGISVCAWSQDSRRLVIAADQTLKVWLCGDDGWRLEKTITHGNEISACSISSCDKMILSGDKNGNLKVWSMDTGKKLAALSGHRDAITDCKFSPDSKQIISSSVDYRSELRIWEVSNWTHWKAIVGHTHWISCCAFTANGKFVVSGSEDGTLRVWNADSCEELVRLNAGAITALSLGHGGRRIVAGDTLGNVYLLNLHGLDAG